MKNWKKFLNILAAQECWCLVNNHSKLPQMSIKAPVFTTKMLFSEIGQTYQSNSLR
jgi:hypothetical protein